MESDNQSPDHAHGQPARTVSATQAARTFSDLLSRVQYRGERFLIERGGELVGELRPLGPPRFTGTDLLALLRALPPPDPQYADDVEALVKSQQTLPRSPWE